VPSFLTAPSLKLHYFKCNMWQGSCSCMHTHTHKNTYEQTHTHMHTHTHTHTQTHMHTHTNTHTHTHAHTQTHTHTPSQTNTHAHTHTYKRTQVGGLRSNLWPGAYVSGKDKQCASMYVGWGIKNAPFVPLPPPDIAQEFDQVGGPLLRLLLVNAFCSSYVLFRVFCSSYTLFCSSYWTHTHTHTHTHTGCRLSSASCGK